MKVIGKWSKSKGDITINIPKIRKVGNKRYPLKVKYLGSEEHPLILTDIEKDLSFEYKVKAKLITKSTRGGDVVEME